MKRMLTLAVLILGLLLPASTGNAGPADHGGQFAFTLIHIKAFADGDPAVDEALSDIAAHLKKMKGFKRFDAWGDRNKLKAGMADRVSAAAHGYKFFLTPTELDETGEKVTVKYEIEKDDVSIINTGVVLKKAEGIFFYKISMNDYTYLIALQVQ